MLVSDAGEVSNIERNKKIKMRSSTKKREKKGEGEGAKLDRGAQFD